MYNTHIIKLKTIPVFDRRSGVAYIPYISHIIWCFDSFNLIVQRFVLKVLLQDPRLHGVDQMQKHPWNTMNYFVNHHIRFDMVIHKEIHSTSQFM